MLVLAIDTASAATSIAVAEVDPDAVTVLARATNTDARAHGEVLTPLIRTGLAEAGITPAELGAIVAGLGPGPFTGLRVGLVTVAALGDALAVPTYGVCSLDAIALPALAGSAPAADPALAAGSRLLVASDARRREVYWAGYTDGVRDGEPQVTRPADIDVSGYAAMAGAGARFYADVLGLPLLDQDYPDAGALVVAAADRVRASATTERLVPLYLRRPDAVAASVRKSVLS